MPRISIKARFAPGRVVPTNIGISNHDVDFEVEGLEGHGFKKGRRPAMELISVLRHCAELFSTQIDVFEEQIQAGNLGWLRDFEFEEPCIDELFPEESCIDEPPPQD